MLVVCLGIAVLAVAVFALREPNGHVAASVSHQRSTSNAANQTSTSPAKKSASTRPKAGGDSKSGAAVKDVPLAVLNNTTITGLAQVAAARFKAGGWTVTKVDNYQNVIASTCAYYDPLVAGARRAAEALQRQYPDAIKRVEPKFAPDPGAAPLPDTPVVVVLTPDYSPA
jgi:hypothetical protein